MGLCSRRCRALAYQSYAREVVHEEWPLMEQGQATPTGWEPVDDIRATVQEIEPNTRAEGALYTEGLDQVEELKGQGGNDKLLGGVGNDKVVGSGGSDFLYGEGGADALNSKDRVNGNDSLDGGAGTDTKVTGTTEKSIVRIP